MGVELAGHDSHHSSQDRREAVVSPRAGLVSGRCLCSRVRREPVPRDCCGGPRHRREHGPDGVCPSRTRCLFFQNANTAVAGHTLRSMPLARASSSSLRTTLAGHRTLCDVTTTEYGMWCWLTLSRSIRLLTSIINFSSLHLHCGCILRSYCQPADVACSDSVNDVPRRPGAS